ncbi:hypothetical protein BLS_002128 [Venturia inaequalis]|uniref:DUF8004 domain-containing protein n=1 Tax=Venturia inaequalis TaxID=5025 RepID=A0A8H3U5B2_VENIN|nr:hypothetical protein EG328_010727 [Venturia inaequalis]KAE9976320.1 hypothetical protein BLS_002128 [Venturia inaequalis]RDI76841.1 hypothetical protein Vi05172_g13188 [Venturia inaequalis]
MASRGARARKVTTKQIEKIAEKNVDKERAERFAKLHSPTPNARPTSPLSSMRQHPWTKRPAVLSSNASVASGESNGSSNRFSSAVVSKISSRVSSNGPDEKRGFVSKGEKVTAYPRGRGGGVPTKVGNAKVGTRDWTRNTHSFEGRAYSISSGSQGTAQQPNVDTSWADTRIWVGNGQAPKPYRGFEHDDDMWQADGNCLIFFSEETDEEDPRPMLRVHTSMLEQARSTFMINLLKYGEIVPEEEQPTPPSRQNTEQNSQWPLNSTSLGSLDELLSESRGAGGYSDDLRPPQSPILRSSNRETWSTSDQTMWLPGGTNPTGGGRGPANFAESVTAAGSDGGDVQQNPPGPVEITHEIWFRAPSHIKRADIQRRHHMATRNYLALLYGLPIIGNDFYEMLSDLQNVMDTYYELNEPSERWNSAQVLVQFVTQMQLDDVRGNIKHALGLLAWSEQSNVMWDAGYLEGFVHCVGMMTQETLKLREYRSLSQISRHKLQNANNAMQLRLIEAEERLSRFDFPEMWYIDGVSNSHPTQKSFEAFRDFLYGFYEAEYGQWPPRHEDHQGHWLNRSLMGRLQADFGAIYQYWVDREIAWDSNEERHTRKWEMAPTRLRAGGFEADSPGLPITDMLIGFDSSQKYDHIPHPYPLLPTSRSPSPNMKSARKSIFSKFKSFKEPVKSDVKSQYQMALAFNTASNINRLGTSFEDNKIIDEIGIYEKSFQMSGVQPHEARLGRWVLLYGILQVLSTVSVDTLGLKYKDKIKYFISPSLEGCPPWRSLEAAPLMIDACQQRSYCWQAPQTWGENRSALSPPGYSNHQYELNEPPSSPIELDSRALNRNRSMMSMNSIPGGMRSRSPSSLLRSPTVTVQLPSPMEGQVSSPGLPPSRNGTLRVTPVLMGQSGRDLKPEIPSRDQRRVSPLRSEPINSSHASSKPDARVEGFYKNARPVLPN